VAVILTVVKNQLNNTETVSMTSDRTSVMTPIPEFVASKQIQLFQGLKQHGFSGQLVLQDLNDNKWIFFLYWGRIIYVTGGLHPVRRWRRHLATYLPHIASQLQEELNCLDTVFVENIDISWDYDLLSLWVEQQKVEREAATKMIRAIVTEAIFDITQTGEIIYQLIPQEKPVARQLAMVDSEQQIVEAWKLWQAWQGSQLETYSPDLAPAIKNLEQLQARTSEKTYQVLTRLVDGRHSLRDLAVQKQTDVIVITRSIIHYVKLGLLELIAIPDLSPPISISTPPAS
jgi:chemotaxis family two-component system response regulator PixG